MNTFDAIAYIEDHSMKRAEALSFLIERAGMNAVYADEIVAIVFAGKSAREESPESAPSAFARSA